jgi:hypothetical protein
MMKKKLKFGILTGLFFCSVFITSCPRKQPANSDFGFTCTRLSNCYANYSSQLTDASVRKSVEDSLNSKDENKCNTAILQFSAAVKQECPF